MVEVPKDPLRFDVIISSAMNRQSRNYRRKVDNNGFDRESQFCGCRVLAANRASGLRLAAATDMQRKVSDSLLFLSRSSRSG